MGDDLGEIWGSNVVESDGEEESAAASVAPKSMKNQKGNATAKAAKKASKNTGNAADTEAMAGRKRGRSQLSAEGFEEEDSEDENEDGVEEYGSEDEEKRLEEEEAKRAKAEKKKAKLKALKAKLKEKKKQRITGGEEISGASGGGGARGGGRKTASAGDGDEEATELWAKFSKVRGDLVTPLELDRPWIIADSLARVDGFGAHTLVKLVGFIKASLPDWKKRIQNRNSNAPRGSPSVLIVCAGARRCVEVMKHLTAFRCQVVKLFAKHLKIEEQKVMLKKACFPVAVGTPGRMHALAATGALRLDSAALLVLDMEKNIKGRDVLDMDGVANDTMGLLADYARAHLVTSRQQPKQKSKGTGGNTSGQLRVALY